MLDPGAFRSAGKAPRGNLRVGHDPEFYEDAEPAVRDGVAQALAACRELGADVQEVRLPKPDAVVEMHTVIFAAKSTAYHMRAFAPFRTQYPPLAKSMFEIAERHRSSEYVLAMRERQAVTHSILGLYRHVDLILLPTLPVLAPIRDAETVRLGSRDLDYTMAMVRYTCLFDHTGQPTVALPSAIAEGGLCIGVQVIGNLGQEAAVLSFADQLERALDLTINFQVIGE